VRNRNLTDQTGLSAGAIADRLGHARPSVSQDVYPGRRPAYTGAAQALESPAF